MEADGMVLMGADTPDRMEYAPGTNISISLSGDDESQLRGYFEKLSAGGPVTMPLEKATWGDIFGLFTDKFGINWLVNISASQGLRACHCVQRERTSWFAQLDAETCERPPRRHHREESAWPRFSDLLLCLKTAPDLPV
jgi:hypothetical protein